MFESFVILQAMTEDAKNVFGVGDDLKFWQGSEQVAGVALLVGVADELGVQLLVAGEGDASGLLVILLFRIDHFVNTLQTMY